MAKSFDRNPPADTVETPQRTTSAAMTLDELLDAMPADERERVHRQAEEFSRAREAAKP